VKNHNPRKGTERTREDEFMSEVADEVKNHNPRKGTETSITCVVESAFIP